MIAMDSRGHGRSTDGPGPITYDEMAEDASGVLRGLGVERAHQVRSIVAISLNPDPFALIPDAFAELGPMALDNPVVEQVRALYVRMNPEPDHFAVFFDKVATNIRTEPHMGAEDLARIRRLPRHRA